MEAYEQPQDPSRSRPALLIFSPVDIDAQLTSCPNHLTCLYYLRHASTSQAVGALTVPYQHYGCWHFTLHLLTSLASPAWRYLPPPAPPSSSCSSLLTISAALLPTIVPSLRLFRTSKGKSQPSHNLLTPGCVTVPALTAQDTDSPYMGKVALDTTEPMPAGSKMDLPLAKAEPISNGGSVSVITQLRKTVEQQPEEMSDNERNNPTDTKPMEVNGGVDIHLQPVEDPMPEQVDAPEGGCDLMESLCWSKLLAGPMDPWRERSPCWSRFAGRTCDPVGDPRWSSLCLKDCTLCKGSMLEQFVKNCSPWEGLMLEKFMEDCLLWEGHHSGAGEECEEEGAVETTCDELTATPIPHPPALLGRGKRHTSNAVRVVSVMEIVDSGAPFPLGTAMGHEQNCSITKPVLFIDLLFISRTSSAESKPPLVQLEAVSTHPITCYLGEETDPHLSTTSFQDAIGLLGHLGTLLAHIQLAVNQRFQVLLCWAAFRPFFPKPVALHGVVVTQVQDLALGLVEPHTIGLGPSIQPVQSVPTFKQINTPAQLGVICKLTEGALDPFVQIIDKDTKQNWPQHRALGNTTCDQLPSGFNSIHHTSLGQSSQLVFYPAKRTSVQAMSSQFLRRMLWET
ncbi:hypothetical protein QYF61_012796, partial [Mycteria americana]